MKRFYSFIKLLLLIAVIVLAISIMFYESTKDDLINYDRYDGLTNLVNSYDSAKAFILYDPYTREAGIKIENFRNDFTGVFKSAFTNMSNMIRNRGFYDSIYLYILTKKMTGMDGLVDRYLTGMTSFKDFIIIDSKNNILYKFSSNNIIPAYRDYHSLVNIYYTNDYLVISVKYDNPLDLDIETAAVFDTGIIIKKIKETDYNAFFLIEGKIYKNSDFNIDFIKESLKDIKAGKKFTYGNKIIETFPISISGLSIGTLGVIYPSRGIEEVFLLVLKILALLIIIFVLLAVDRLITNSIKRKKSKVRQVKKKEAEAIENEENEKNLDWLENYIKSEEKDEK